MYVSIHADLPSLPPGYLAITLQDPAAPPGPAAPAPSGFSSMWLPMVAVLAVFWFVMIGPERKNRKKREAMLGALKKGDRVMTTSGIYGTVGQVQGNIVTLSIADGVRVRVSLASIQGLEEEKAADDKAAAGTEAAAGKEKS